MTFVKGHVHSPETRIKLSVTGKGRIPWNRGKKMSQEYREKLSKAFMGRKLSEEHKQKLSKRFSDEKSMTWKGDKVSYSGLHKWITKKYGKANRCELTDETCAGRFEWSNISKEYRRDINDFWQLCTSHHTRYDKELL